MPASTAKAGRARRCSRRAEIDLPRQDPRSADGAHPSAGIKKLSAAGGDADACSWPARGEPGRSTLGPRRRGSGPTKIENPPSRTRQAGGQAGHGGRGVGRPRPGGRRRRSPGGRRCAPESRAGARTRWTWCFCPWTARPTLNKLPALVRGKIAPAGAIWVVRRKGKRGAGQRGREHGRGQGRRPGRHQGRGVLGDPHRRALRHSRGPTRTPTQAMIHLTLFEPHRGAAGRLRRKRRGRAPARAGPTPRCAWWSPTATSRPT